MALSGVVGTGAGMRDGEPCVAIFVVKKTSELLAKIPATIDGYPVDVRETGQVRALTD